MHALCSRVDRNQRGCAPAWKERQDSLVVLLRRLAVFHHFRSRLVCLSLHSIGRVFPTRALAPLVRVGLQVLEDFGLAEREAGVLRLVVVRDDQVLDLCSIKVTRGAD